MAPASSAAPAPRAAIAGRARARREHPPIETAHTPLPRAARTLSTKQKSHHVCFDLAKYAGTSTNNHAPTDLGALIADAITPETFTQSCAQIINEQLNKDPEHKLLHRSPDFDPRTRGENDRRTSAPAKEKSPNTATESLHPPLSPLPSQNLAEYLDDATPTSAGASERGEGAEMGGGTGQGERKEEPSQKPQQSKTKASLTQPYRTNPERQRVIEMTLDGRLPLNFDDTGSIYHGKEILGEILQLHDVLAQIYASEHLNKVELASAPVEAVHSTVYDYVQTYLREAKRLWKKAKKVDEQLLLQDIYHRAGTCPIMNHLGVQVSIVTAGMETQAAVTAMFRSDWSEEIGSVIQGSRNADRFAEGLISQGLGVSAKNFNLFGRLRSAIIGTASRESTKTMVETLKNMTINPDELCNSFYRRVQNQHIMITQQESLLPHSERHFTMSIANGAFSPASIVLTGCRVNASHATADFYSPIYDAEIALRELADKSHELNLDQLHGLSMYTAKRVCDEIDREHVPTFRPREPKNKPRTSSQKQWSQLVTEVDSTSDVSSTDENRAFLYQGQHGGCAYCGMDEKSHDVNTCARKAFDKYNNQLGANAQQSYIDHQRSQGREDCITPSGPRTLPFPSTLKDFYEDRGEYLNLLSSGNPNKSGGTRRSNDKNQGTSKKQNGPANSDKIITDLKAFMTTLIKESKVKKPGAGGRTRKHRRRPIKWDETDDESDTESESEITESEDEPEEFTDTRKGKHKNKD